MNYLIDTNIFIWFIQGNENFPDKYKNIIENRDNKIFLSIASIWEIAIKHSLGKLELKKTFKELIPGSLIANDINILQLEIKHIEYGINLPFFHKDPFDRIIISQSIVENIPLIYTDEIFNSYPLIK